jgi:hypothetical protein
MYTLSDSQIDQILSDIRARGVEMESLQQNLLDHVCCIIEQNLEEKGDFESFYQKTIASFYKDALWEIEEETLSLLTFKHYYIMKKSMILSGVFSAGTMALGILFKFLHLPGAAAFLIMAIVSGSLIFLPLLFTLKAKEKQSTKDKLVLAIGGLSAVLLSLSILFKVMYWPLANWMGNASLVILLAVFLPIYFFAGVRHPETKVNTITSSVLLVLGCGLFLTLMRSPRSTLSVNIKNTHDFVRSQQILKNEQRQLKKMHVAESLQKESSLLAQKINEMCEALKKFIVQEETGVTEIGEDFALKNTLIEEHSFGSNPFLKNEGTRERYTSLIKMIDQYNREIAHPALSKIPVKDSFIQYFGSDPYFGSVSTLTLLNQLTYIQMFVLQNERELLASNC